MSTEFVSIVGVSRSGTSLMRNILDCSDELAVAEENYFIGHLIERDGVRHRLRQLGDLNDDAVVARAVDFIYNGELLDKTIVRNWGHWRWLRDHVPREQMIEALCKTDRSDRELFLAFLKPYAEFHHKTIVGEKTPSHVLYVDTIMRWFPDARVLHMMRDPRGNFYSEYTRRQRAPKINRGPGPLLYRIARRSDLLLKLVVLGVVLFAWRRSAMAASANLEKYPGRYMMVKFEDLVTDQDGQVRRASEFLGIRFTDAMLDQRVVRGANIGDQGFDKSKVDRWRDEVPGWVDRLIRLRLGKQMKRLGYL